MTGGTLGALLYRDEARAPVSESDWVALVRSIAEGDQHALHALYQRTHRIVFTLLLRITGERGIAEELTLGVFHDVWRCAPGYDSTAGPVTGWILDQARARALDRMRLERREQRDERPSSNDRRRLLASAMTFLTPEERQAIEAASEPAPARSGEARVRASLAKLRNALAPEIGATAATRRHRAEHSERVFEYALQVVPARDVAIIEANIFACAGCREELEELRPILDAAVVSWPSDLLSPSASLRGRLAQRIATETGGPLVLPVATGSAEPEWRAVAPGISCKLLATDPEHDRVSMLVRLAPGTEYPPHRHAGLEELYLLNGELGIDHRQLRAGDYSWAEAGSVDRRVWSGSGCTCLLITSDRDEILGPDAQRTE